MTNLNKHIVVIGASRGIGKSTVELLALQKNVTVFALSRNLERMEKSFSRLTNVHCFHFDLAKDNVKEQAYKIFKQIGHIDYLINNAGYLVNKPFLELTRKDFEHSFQINTIGAIETVQTAIPFMKKGHIVNISSMGGFQGSMKFPGLTAYSSSKAALVCFTEMFAEEYKETEIQMNCLCLGAVQTEMLEEAFPGYKAPLSPEEMAEFIVLFTLNNYKWMNGKIIPVSLSNP